MNSQNYTKKYKLNSEDNEYIVQFESLDEGQKIRIILTYTKYNQNFNFSIEKCLIDVKMEFEFLTCKSTKELVDYLSVLTKKDQISICQKFTYMNIISFFDNDKCIQFNLRRRIDTNENRIGEIEEEILNIYNKLESLEDSVESQKKITKDLKEEFQKKYENLESKLNEINQGKCIGVENTVYESQIYNINVEDDKVMKDNNNSIKFNSLCYNMNKKEPIVMENNNEECEFFTAFNLKNNDPMIAWTIRSCKNIINIINMKNQKKFSVEICKNKIDCLQYFCNYNNNNDNNEFIISLSKNDENYFIAWKINNGVDLNLQIFKKINIKYKISVFTMFSYIKYSNKESYIFIYDENNRDRNQKGILLYKIDNNFDISSSTLIEEDNQVQYLDTYYDVKKIKEGKLYLIDCNSNNITLFEDPFTDREHKKIFKEKGESNHLCGFIVERNNNLELFETNHEGINVWDINNNIKPKLKIQLNHEFPFDIGIWNDELFWAVTSSGSKFFQIIEDKIREKKSSINILKGSKIRKIIVGKNESIVGVDSNRNLCLWNNQD